MPHAPVPPLRPLEAIFADIEALPLSRDPFRQLEQMPALNRLFNEAELDGGPGSRDDEIRQHPDAARILLGVIDRILPLFDDAEISWMTQPFPRHLFPENYYQVEDPLLFFLLGEYVPGLPGFAEALVELVQRNPQAWSVQELLGWYTQHKTHLVGGVDVGELLERLKQIELPASVRRAARNYVGGRPAE